MEEAKKERRESRLREMKDILVPEEEFEDQDDEDEDQDDEDEDY